MTAIPPPGGPRSGRPSFEHTYLGDEELIDKAAATARTGSPA